MSDITEEMIEAGARSLTDDVDRGMGPDHQQWIRERARNVLEAALAGRTVIELPDPDKREDECGVMAATWHLRQVTAAFRPPNVMSYAIDDDPVVFDGPGPEHTYTVAEMRERCLAGLAACADAERLASGSSESGDPKS